jgi:alpha-mannosidase
MSAEEMQPAEVDHVVGQDKAGDPERPLPPEGRGFLNIDNQHVLLVTWKRAEDKNGSILRLAETAGKPEEAVVHFPHVGITSAWLASGVEDDSKSLPVDNDSIHLSFQPFEVLTVRVAEKK